MKCRKCGQTAAINMRQHKLALCGTHFQEWVPAQVQRAIEKYSMFAPTAKILVAVSGGKDSLSLWDILFRLGYTADGLYLDLGIDGGRDYSRQSRGFAERFAAARGLTLHVISVAERCGAPLPELVRLTQRGQTKPCALCGLVKRYLMNRAAAEGGYAVLATGHNLDDEAAVLMQNTLQWAGGYLARQAPVLTEREGLIRKVKPLCRLYERELAAYAIICGIEYVYDECPHVVGSTTLWYKEILNRLEDERHGLKLQFYLSFLQAKAGGLFAQPTEVAPDQLRPCTRCSQPTSAPGECSFCRLLERVRASRHRPGD